jgi:RNA polymerase sigma factor (sigma-70 family)
MIYLDEIETNALVIQLKAKNKAAYSVLYDQYSKALFGIALRMVSSQSVAEDLLQEAFVKIWKHIDLYDGSKGTLFTWMLNITRNVCKDYFRSRQHWYQTQLAPNGLESIDFKSKAMQMTYKHESQEIEQLTQRLDLKYKEIIDLVYIQGYTQEEVAQMLQIPLGTVKTRSRNALKQLRNIYDM